MSDVGDLDRLFRASVEAAGQALAAGRQLWPFAVAVDEDGALVSPQVDPGVSRPEVEGVVRLLLEALRLQRDGLRAAALLTPVRVDGAPALRVELEERDGDAVTVVVAYALPGPELQQPVRGPGRRQVWDDPASSARRRP